MRAVAPTALAPAQDLWYQLDVMMIEWDGEHEVAYRVDMFAILEDTWMKARPEWKLITLG